MFSLIRLAWQFMINFCDAVLVISMLVMSMLLMVGDADVNDGTFCR